jgi:hypothetical protein
MSSLAKLFGLIVLVAATRVGADTTAPADRRGTILCTFSTNHCASSGGCRFAAVTLYTDGKLHYRDGGDGLEETRQEKQLVPRQLARLIAAFERARFFSFRSDYVRPPKREDEASADDISTRVTITFRHGRRVKTVDYDEEPSYSRPDQTITAAPRRLVALSSEIADVVDLFHLSNGN